MSAVLAYNNRFHVTADKPATFTSADFDSSPAIANLGRAQLPLFAQFTGATADLDCEANDGGSNPVAFDADVFAVLGLEDFDNGAEVEFLNGSTSLGTVTIETAPLGGNHAILILDSSVNLDTLTVSFTGAGSGAHKVGAIWASESLRFSPAADVSFDGLDTGITSFSQGNTAWAYGGQNYVTHAIRCRTREYLDWLTALRSAKSNSPVLYQLEQRLLTDPLIKAYGYLDNGWNLSHFENSIYDASARMVEVL